MKKQCQSSFDCKGECWLNVAGNPPFSGIVASNCKGTLEEQKINDDFFNGKKTKLEICKFYKINE